MSNEKVIKAFINKQTSKTPNRPFMWGGYGCTLQSDGCNLINYSTVIARWVNGMVELNEGHYSQTTSKIQSQLKRALDEAGIKHKPMK